VVRGHGLVGAWYAGGRAHMHAVAVVHVRLVQQVCMALPGLDCWQYTLTRGGER
jgi:hypothetical protein